MSNPAVCWQCGASLEQLSLPLSRFDACKACRAELHVCKQCRFFDVTVAKQCREPVADEVRDKQHANFCGYFTLKADAWAGDKTAHQDQARAALDALFKK